MKKILIFITFILICSYVSAQTSKSDTAIVSKVRGVPVFVMCQPTSQYEVVGSVKDTDTKFLQKPVARGNITINESCNILVEIAQNKQKEDKFDYDAIIISDNARTGTLIKFK
ncbi:MAG TPA: hypothetical protein VMV47_04940 [Bacteroidales bacterium]|nr:hypothetical protein [Bacteroidales bacterium]